MSDPTIDDLSEPVEPSPVVAQQGSADLDRIERDLADVEIALTRLSDGTYFHDEITGEPISDGVLELDPLARRER